ncbi:cysteine-rich receptor-like protein kinase 15 [Silene latifolia]|uniref:cysteine-rich receptor-like protein kinase 15 n=1 Tax=Silene latifolia TaxID=37657 RepID=UPI003D777C1B
MASTLVLAFVVVFLLHMGHSSGFGESYLASKCKGTGNNAYGLYLRSLLSGMAEMASTRAYYATNTSGHGSEVVYGSYLCRGDISPNECKSCVSNSIDHLRVQCRKSKKGVIWSETCMVRYSDNSFLGIVVEDESVYKSSKRKMVTNQIAYINLAWNLFQNMAEEFYSQMNVPATKTKYFGYHVATIDVSYAAKVYAMAQCTPDLSPYDCRKCLQVLTDDIPALCSGSISCYMLNPSCNARYEPYAFSDTFPGSSPPPPSHDQSNTPAQSLKRKTSLVLGIVIPLSIGLGILIISSLIYLHRKRREATTYGDLDDFGSLRSMIFTYASVKRATSNFAEVNKVGQGGFGEVYKGKLSNGEVVAIKRLARNSGQGLDQFKNEVMLLAKLQHKNLVKLIGFCISKTERVLIYEFLPNSSLDRILFDRPRRASLEWESRFRIIIGVAKAVLYLHEDSRLKIIHRDLKPSNILLDHQMNPKVADLGLARLFNDDQSQSDTNGIVGTPGYMAPEYARQGKISAKSDVYSLGIVILEIISGQRNGFSDQQQDDEGLIPRAWRLWTEGAVLDLLDSSLPTYSHEQVALCIQIALLCMQQEPNQRPTMMSIVVALNGDTATSLPVPNVPLCFATVSEPTTGPTMASILAALREESLLVPEIQTASD